MTIDPLNYWLNNDGPPYLGPTGLHEWARAIIDTAAANAASGSLSVKGYGATGDGVTDDTAAIQAAINAAAPLGLATYFPGGRYRITATLTLPSGTTLLGAGRGVTIIDITGLGASVAGGGATALLAQGSLSASPATITVDVVKAAKTCTVASATGLAVGDLVLLSSDDLFHTTAALKKGELKRIEDITGTTVTFEEATFDSYTAASAAKLTVVTPVRGIAVTNLTVEGTNDDNMERGLYVFAGEDVRVRDTEFRYCDWNSINLRLVNRFRVDGCDFLSVPWVDNAPNYYGLVVENGCQHGVFARNHGRLCRHLFTTGYTVTIPGVTRFVVALGNTDEYSQSASYDTHNGSEHITIAMNTSSFSEGSGINAEGPNTYIYGNTVTGYSTYGIYVRDGARDCAIVDNRVVAPFAGATTTGIYLRKTHATHKPLRCKIRGNVVEASSHGIYVSEAERTSIIDNDIASSPTYAIRVTTCTQTRVIGNSGTSGNSAVFVEGSTRTLVADNDAGAYTNGVRMAVGTNLTTVIGNDLSGVTTPISTSTGTVKAAHNLGLATHDV